MKSSFYLIGFGVIAISVLFDLVQTIYYLLHISFPLGNLGTISTMFSSPIPPMFRFILPAMLSYAFFYAMVFLVLRRVWLISSSSPNRIPKSFSGVLQKLVYVSVISLLVGFVVLILSILLKAGSGVVAGLLIIPAVFLLPISILVIEVLSFMGTKSSPNNHSSGIR